MTENVCVTCQYYESCNRPERFMKCMGYKRKLQVGDKIQCGDTDDVIKAMKDLAKEGVETDFLYEKRRCSRLMVGSERGEVKCMMNRKMLHS